MKTANGNRVHAYCPIESGAVIRLRDTSGKATPEDPVHAVDVVARDGTVTTLQTGNPFVAESYYNSLIQPHVNDAGEPLVEDDVAPTLAEA